MYDTLLKGLGTVLSPHRTPNINTQVLEAQVYLKTACPIIIVQTNKRLPLELQLTYINYKRRQPPCKGSYPHEQKQTHHQTNCNVYIFHKDNSPPK
jgi:hypothetical protein